MAGDVKAGDKRPHRRCRAPIRSKETDVAPPDDGEVRDPDAKKSKTSRSEADMDEDSDPRAPSSVAAVDGSSGPSDDNDGKISENEKKEDIDAVDGECGDGVGDCGDNYVPDRVVPQLFSHGITEGDLRLATKVLEAVSALGRRRGRGGKRKKNNQRKEKETTADDGDNGGEASTADGSGGEDETEEDDDDYGLASYQHRNLRPLRKALAGCFEMHKRVLYGGKGEDSYYADRLAERTLRRQKMAERAKQRDYVARTRLRRGRIERLERLKEEARDEVVGKLRMLVPDGHVDTAAEGIIEVEGGVAAGGTPLLKDGPSAKRGTDSNGRGASFEKEEEEKKKESIRLPQLRSCYVCKVRFRDMHHFYDQLCPSCADLNYSKRHFSVSMEGKVAVVTGSRVKIGYQTCLKLLRAGCSVVATTRFPNSAARAYRQEKDFDQWRDKLHVYGLDLRDVTGLEAFTRFLKVRYGETGIDILINNACQTVRRPRGYFSPMVTKEQEIWRDADDTHRDLLRGCVEFEQARRRLVVGSPSGDGGSSGGPARVDRDGGENIPILRIEQDQAASPDSPSGRKSSNREARASRPPDELAAAAAAAGPDLVPFETTGLSHSAAMTQMVVLPEDVGVSSSVLPPGASDVNGQQVDLRTTNSWLLKMDEVSTPEVMECMLINAIAPFVLNGRLQPLMTAPDNGPSRPDRYIINVSAMEGKFYRYKMPNHPHTNMAKAALNMLTRTSSEDLAKRHRIFMNSVDTGWINDENPLEKARKISTTNLFQTPIDEIDAAARVLDPIFAGVAADQAGGVGGSNVKKSYGKFFKDYRESEW